MPRIKNELYQRKYKVNDLYLFIEGEMRKQKISQNDLGHTLGIQQSTVSKNIKNHTFSTFELVTALDLIGYEISLKKKGEK